MPSLRGHALLPRIKAFVLSKFSIIPPMWKCGYMIRTQELKRLVQSIWLISTFQDRFKVQKLSEKVSRITEKNLPFGKCSIHPKYDVMDPTDETIVEQSFGSAD